MKVISYSFKTILHVEYKVPLLRPAYLKS